MLQIKTDLYRYVHYTSNVAVCNYQELIGCDVSFMVVLISERHGGLFNQTLQDFASPDEAFDLIYAAAAFHWIPEEYGYNRVFNLIKPGGAFARFAYHAGVDKGREAMTEEIQKIYSKYLHPKKRSHEFGTDDARKIAEIACQYGFSDTVYRLYYVTKDFTADEYMALLRTYPDHMKVEESTRKKFFEGIHSAIKNHGGIITVYYTMDLELARKPN